MQDSVCRTSGASSAFRVIIQTARKKPPILLGHEGLRLAVFQAARQEDVSLSEIMPQRIKAETWGS